MRSSTPSRSPLLKRGILCFYALVWIAAIAFVWDPSSVLPSHGEPITLQLARGPFTFLEYQPRSAPKALVIFASGDGGWNSFEESIARTLCKNGYDVVGIDSMTYARTDYDLDSLQADFRKIVQSSQAPYGSHPPPLIMSGYSMGAAQMTAATAGPNPPPHISGLLLIDMCARGRYGLRTSDQLNVLPTGPGTFAVADFAGTIRNMRVVQWHAAEDEIDSLAWLSLLTVPYRQLDFPGTGHEYSTGRDEFLNQLVDSLGWLLHGGSADPITIGNKN